MIKILNGSAAGEVLRCDDYYIREQANGLDELIFSISIWDPQYSALEEEMQLQDRDRQTYLIKQIDGGENTAKVVAQIDLDAWKAEMHLAYGNGIKTAAETIDAIKPEGWTVIDRSGSTLRRSVNGNLTGYEICEQCRDVFNVWIRWDNAAKTCTIISKALPDPAGAFATRDLNLKTINYKGKSNDIKTRLYAFGQDNMTFADINGGLPYIDDNRYTDKVLPMYWKDERYTVKENLLADARVKLAELAVPHRSYECAIVDLQAADPERYGFLDFSLFTVATLIDDVKNFAVDYQVIERRIYPFYPEKNEVIFDSEPQKITNIVENTQALLETKASTAEMQIEVDRATGVLQTGLSGFVVIGRNDDGYANELLFLDTNSLETARQVLRINKAGIGFSSTGYQGPYYQSWTLDGHFALGGVNNAYGDFEILSAQGKPLGEWDKDGLKLYDDAENILLEINAGGLYLYDAEKQTLAKMTNEGLGVYAGTIDLKWNGERGLYFGATEGGTDELYIGDFMVSTKYGRQVLQSSDERTGMSGQPTESGGLYLWAGWQSANSYKFVVNDTDAYVQYNGETYPIGESIDALNRAMDVADGENQGADVGAFEGDYAVVGGLTFNDIFG